jgi:hypothetical protein
MKYNEQTESVKKIIIELVKNFGYDDPKYTNLNEIDYKFWEDNNFEDSVIILAQRVDELWDKLYSKKECISNAEKRNEFIVSMHNIVLKINNVNSILHACLGRNVDYVLLESNVLNEIKTNDNWCEIYSTLAATCNGEVFERVDINEEPKFTINEIRAYLLSKDSMGDVLYYLNAENINKANQIEEIFEE